MSQAVGKVMLEQKSGKIINIASVAGLKGSNPQYMNAIGYNSSKGAVITFTKGFGSQMGTKWYLCKCNRPKFADKNVKRVA